MNVWVCVCVCVCKLHPVDCVCTLTFVCMCTCVCVYINVGVKVTPCKQQPEKYYSKDFYGGTITSWRNPCFTALLFCAVIRPTTWLFMASTLARYLVWMFVNACTHKCVSVCVCRWDNVSSSSVTALSCSNPRLVSTSHVSTYRFIYTLPRLPGCGLCLTHTHTHTSQYTPHSVNVLACLSKVCPGVEVWGHHQGNRLQIKGLGVWGGGGGEWEEFEAGLGAGVSN